jgi:hypothetical protein
MFAYEVGNKIYCAGCYKKVIPEKDQKPIHRMDGIEFHHRFQDYLVKCAKCGVPIQYDDLEKTPFQSLGE